MAQPRTNPSTKDSTEDSLNDQRTRKKEENSEKDNEPGQPGLFKNDPDKEGEDGKTSTAPNSTGRH
jgi:hypothetical protein